MAPSAQPIATMSAIEFEHALQDLLSRQGPETCQKDSIEESVFDRLRTLLNLNGKQQWAERPRTYFILFFIDRLDALDKFVEVGFLDIQLPCRARQLTPLLDDEESREQFLEAQHLVLSKCRDMEHGGHRHFPSPSDVDKCFFLKGELGSGRTGKVDQVVSKISLEEYARKRICRRVLPRGQRATAELESEIETLKRLHHSHLVEFVGSYTDPEYVGLLIKPVADCDLRQFMSTVADRQLFILQNAFGCLSAALQYLHNQRCRHKDIKPANILVKNGSVLLTDFGTSRNWVAGDTSTTVGTSGPYTPAYAAPEVAEWESRNEAADIWSLGCVFLEMLTILKGKKLDDIKDFFETHGTGNRNPRTNYKAYTEWLLELQSLRTTHNEPIRWIRLMLMKGPRYRITATELLMQVRSYYEPDADIIYCGHCCRGSESDLSSIGKSSATAYDQNSEDVADQDTDCPELAKISTNYPDRGRNLERMNSTTSQSGPQRSRHSSRTLARKWSALNAGRRSKHEPPRSRNHGNTRVKPHRDKRPNFVSTSESESDSDLGPGTIRYLPRQVREQVWREELQERLSQFHSYAEGREEHRAQKKTSASHSLLVNIHESPFTLKRGSVSAEPLCKWIIDTCLQYYRIDDKEVQMTLSLCLLVITFSFASSTADNCALDLLPPVSRHGLIEFGRRGRKIRSRFERFLRRCERTLLDEVLEGPSDDLLPKLYPRQAKAFFEAALLDQVDVLGSITDAMTNWCVEIKGTWLKTVLDHQAIENATEQSSRTRALEHENVKLSHQSDSAPIAPAPFTPSQHCHDSIDVEQSNSRTALCLVYCTSLHCVLCSKKFVLSSSVPLSSHNWHRDSRISAVIHRTTTTISRDFVNHTALRRSGKFDWICGIRDQRTYISASDSGFVDDWVRAIYKCMQEHSADGLQSFNLVPGLLTQSTLEKLVKETQIIRQARKDKEKASQEVDKDINRSGRSTSLSPTLPRGRPNIGGKGLIAHQHRHHTSSRIPRIDIPPASGEKGSHSYSSTRKRRNNIDPNLGYHSMKPPLPRRRSSISELRRHGSGPSLYSTDFSLDHTLGLVRKASVWFKKLASGRRSAPPHERTGSRKLDRSNDFS